MSKIISLTDYKGSIKELKAAMGFGRNLALNNDQTEKLKENPKTKTLEYLNQSSNEEQKKEEIIEETTQTNVESTENPPVEENPVLESNPVINEEIGVMDISNPAPINIEEENIIPPAIDIEPVVMPIIEEQPKEEAKIEPSPIEENPIEQNQVEIVKEEGQNQDFEQLINEIAKINDEFNQKIIEINEERAQKIKDAIYANKNKLIEQQEQIIDLKNRAEEHLKNAQAAEQIATIAHQNAQNVVQNENNDIFV